MILVFERETESDMIMAILEKVKLLEYQAVIHSPTMYQEVVQVALSTLTPEEQLNARIYYGNYVSVVGIFRSTTLFSSLFITFCILCSVFNFNF